MILGMLRKDQDCSGYFNEVEDFAKWCGRNYLSLNVQRTKEIVFDFGRKATVHPPVVMGSEEVKRVGEYKYLGTIIDEKLSWNQNVDNLCKRARKRIYFLKKLNEFQVDSTIQRLFYNSVIYSVITFCMVAWYSSLSKCTLLSLERINKVANRIIRDNDNQELLRTFQCKVGKNVGKILLNIDHPLYEHYQLLKSGVRFRSVMAKTNRYRDSFVPKSITLINSMTVSERSKFTQILEDNV
jgi:hypothetical protein